MKLFLRIIFIGMATALLNPCNIQAQSTDQKMAELQLEEIAHGIRVREAEEALQNTQAQIASIKNMPNLYGKRYFDFLKDTLTTLRDERKVLPARYRETSQKVAILDAQIAFIQDVLKKQADEKAAKTGSQR